MWVSGCIGPDRPGSPPPDGTFRDRLASGTGCATVPTPATPLAECLGPQRTADVALVDLEAPGPMAIPIPPGSMGTALVRDSQIGLRPFVSGSWA